MDKLLKDLLGVAGVVALMALTVLLVALTQDADKLTVSTQAVMTNTTGTLAKVDATITDARRVLLIAGGTLNIARDTMRDQQKTVKAESQAILDTTRNVNAAVRHIDANSATAFNQLGVSLQGLTPVMAAATETLTKTGKTVDSLNAVVNGPVMGTLTNVQGVTADVQTEVHRFVYPPPRKWYQKYIIDPAKIAGHLLTYSVK